MFKLDEQEGLRGLDHRSVIPYVHRICCITMCVSLLKGELNLKRSEMTSAKSVVVRSLYRVGQLQADPGFDR
jgi:hypothetical protein